MKTKLQVLFQGQDMPLFKKLNSINHNQHLFRSTAMKNATGIKCLGREIATLLITLAIVATLAMGQNLVVGSGSTFAGNGQYIIAGSITNTAPVTINGVVTLNGQAGQTIGTTGQIDFQTLNVNTTSGNATMAVSTAVSTALSIANGSTFDIQNNTLGIGGTSTLHTSGVLTVGSSSTVNFTSGTAQDILPHTYANLGLSGGGAKTFPIGTSTVNTLLTASDSVTVTGVLAFAATASASFDSDLVNNGTFTAPTTTGVVTFGGGNAQIIGGLNALAFNKLTLNGGGVKNADVDISVAGQLTVNQNLIMDTTNHRLLTMLDAAKSTQPIYGSLKEITGRMRWEAFSAQTYKFNNASTEIAFSGANGARTFELNVKPATNPTGYQLATSVNRKINATYAGWSTGTADIQLAYQNGEADGSLVQARLKEFHGAIASADKLGGIISRGPSGVGSFGYVKHANLASTAFTSGDEISLDTRFSPIISVAIASWNLPTTWDANAIPTSSDDVEINTAVLIPDEYAAAALSTTINNGGGIGLTVGGGASGTLAVGAGGLTNNNSTGTGLTVATGASVTVTGSSVTNAGAISNSGTIRVQ
jgi:hypothetical protein